MRVRELIEALKACDPEAEVLVVDSIGGYDDTVRVEPGFAGVHVYDGERHVDFARDTATGNTRPAVVIR